MKTLQELVDKLNEIYATQGKYIIEHESCTGTLSLYYIRNDIRHSLAMLKPRYRTWSLWPSIGFQGLEAQHAIIDYLTNSNPSDWFPTEKKYNIIVGPSYKDGDVVAYHKTEKEECFSVLRKVMCLDSFVSKNDLHREDYQFTESEIEQLKSTLSENKAKIVDLGKVEVKDD